MKGYKVALHKAYFDQGYGFTTYGKYMIAFFGLASRDVNSTLLIGVAYGIFCYLFGMFLYKVGYVEAAAEVGNQYNKFQKEVRKKLTSQKI